MTLDNLEITAQYAEIQRTKASELLKAQYASNFPGVVETAKAIKEFNAEQRAEIAARQRCRAHISTKNYRTSGNIVPKKPMID